MADEQRNSESHTLREPDIHSEPDILLMAIVHTANTYALSLDITLDVSGVIVSGTLISGSEFFKHMAQQVMSFAPRTKLSEEAINAREAFAQLYETFATQFEEQSEQEQTRDHDKGVERVGAPVRYIHLRNAAVLVPDVLQPLQRTIWRGRLSHVSGWSYGRF